MKILLAEDDNDMRRFLAKALQNAGYDVVSYDNGKSAYERLREEPFTLLLTDIVMPEMDGIEATQRIVKEVAPAPRVIMVSASTQEGAVATLKALRAGAADFISKSTAFADTDLGQLDAELRDRLRQWRTAAAAPVKVGEVQVQPEPTVESTSAPADLIVIATGV